MKLVRLALLRVEAEVENLNGFQICNGPFSIGPLQRLKGRENCFLVPAEIELPYLPKITAEGFVRVPDAERIAAEEGIEHYANLLAISLHCKRSLSSPTPPVAFIPNGEDEVRFLGIARGLLSPEHTIRNFSCPFRLSLADRLSNLADRLDGVALLAEALGHSHASGRFREMIRVYERAFGSAGRPLIGPLSAFLQESAYGYSEKEIRYWIEIRDGVTHADRRSDVLFEADCKWVNPRLMQAAYDVLLNKSTWRSADALRRSCWKPLVGTRSQDGEPFGTQGAELQMILEIFDPFRRFPLDLEAVITTLPDGWWSAGFSNAGRMGGTLEIRARD